jgi:type IV pilus assembly protein PilX
MDLARDGCGTGSRQCRHARQGGAALIVSLLILIVVLLLGISAAQNALQSEKASRSDRDRQIAFQAAEAGLMDAERDIEGALPGAATRSGLFAPEGTEGFIAGCAAGIANRYLGLCLPNEDPAKPVWQSIDFLDDSPQARSVPYGRFTGQSLPVGLGTLPARLPRYIIELLPDTQAGESAESEKAYFYRITAVGFGTRDTTQVALQTFYRKGKRQ